MHDVNDQYKKVFRVDISRAGCARMFEDFNFLFNFRNQSYDPDMNFVYNIKITKYCYPLPKHYWKIKELY